MVVEADLAIHRAIGNGRPAAAEVAIRDHLEQATSWLIEHVAITAAPQAGTAPSP